MQTSTQKQTTHSSITQERKPFSQYELNHSLISGLLTVVWRIIVIAWIKAGCVDQKILAFLGAVCGVPLCQSFWIVCPTFASWTYTAQNTEWYRCLYRMQWLSFKWQELFHCLIFIRQQQFFMRMIVQMSGLFSIGTRTPALEPDTFNSNCQDLPKSYQWAY